MEEIKGTNPKEEVKLTSEELDVLPARARAYIQELERRLKALEWEAHRTKDQLHKANFRNWSGRK